MSRILDFNLKARQWLNSWKAFDTDGPATIPRITKPQRDNLIASLDELLNGAYQRGLEDGVSGSALVDVVRRLLASRWVRATIVALSSAGMESPATRTDLAEQESIFAELRAWLKQSAAERRSK